MDLTPKQQTSEAIRQAETILITTGQHPSADQVAAVIALSAILRKFGKKVSAIISDAVPQSVQFLDLTGVDKGLSGMRDFILKVDVTKSEVDKLRYEVEGSKLNVYITPFKGGFAPSDVTFGYGDFHYDIAIVLGVPTRTRIDRVYAENQNLFNTIPVVNLDFHRTNESYGAINLIEPTASSLCEILVATSESLQSGLIDADIATVMLTGLMASTDRFTASHTTSKSLTVAAQMMAAGAKQQTVVKGLFRDGRDGGDRDQRYERSERREDRPRDDRGRSNDRPSQPERQRDAVRPEPARAEVARPELTRPEPARPEQVRSEQVQNPEAELTPAPGTTTEESIIEPHHIEPSLPVEPAPEQPAQDVPIGEAVEATPVIEPAAIPMADFASAVELLPTKPVADKSSDEDR